MEFFVSLFFVCFVYFFFIRGNILSHSLNLLAGMCCILWESGYTLGIFWLMWVLYVRIRTGHSNCKHSTWYIYIYNICTMCFVLSQKNALTPKYVFSGKKERENFRERALLCISPSLPPKILPPFYRTSNSWQTVMINIITFFLCLVFTYINMRINIHILVQVSFPSIHLIYFTHVGIACLLSIF